MKARATPGFWECYEALPSPIQKRAQAAYGLWSTNPFHPGLEFKRVKGTRQPVRSVRIGLHWRALGVETDDAIVWFWIGSHADYDRLIATLD